MSPSTPILSSSPIVALFSCPQSTSVREHLSLTEVYDRIRQGVWSVPVAEVRACRQHFDAASDPSERGNAEAAWKAAKGRLPAFTISTDSQTRAKAVPLSERGIVPSGRLQVDLDLHGSTPESRAPIRQSLMACVHTESVFLSPSGDGLKAVIRVAGAGDPATHALAVSAVEGLLTSILGHGNDPAVKDVQRLCYVSHDPELFYNPEATELQISDQKLPIQVDAASCSLTKVLPIYGTFGTDQDQGNAKDLGGQRVAEVVAPPRLVAPNVTITGEGAPIIQGQRNTTLFTLGCGMRGRGMSAASIAAALEGENRVRCHPPLTAVELQRIVQSVTEYAAGEAKAAVDFTGIVPEPLPAELPDVPPLDPYLLPHLLRPFVQDVSERMQAPLDYAAVAMMVVAGSVVGTRCGIRPKKHDDWVVVPNLWGAVIGRPSTLKSPAIADPLHLLHSMEADARKEYDLAMADWKAGEEARDVHRSALREEAKKRAKQVVIKGIGDAQAVALSLIQQGSEEVDPPVRRRYLTNDATVEKLGELLSENPHGILCFRDELAGWLKSMDREGHEQDRAFHLESFNGTGRFTFDRIGRGTVEIEHAVQSVLGGIQPGPFMEYMVRATKDGKGDDGLVQRFQMLTWPDQPSDFTLVDRYPLREAKTVAKEVLSILANIDPISIGAVENRGINSLGFTDEAQELWSLWYTKLMRRLRQDDLPAPLAAHLGKQPKTCPALALVIHLCDGGKGPVEKDALERAIGWCNYLEGHANRVYHAALTGEYQSARALASRILDGDISESFSLRELHRHHWTLLSDNDTCKGAIDILADHGWLIPEPCALIQKGRPPADRWWIHPLVFSLFAGHQSTPSKEHTITNDNTPKHDPQSFDFSYSREVPKVPKIETTCTKLYQPESTEHLPGSPTNHEPTVCVTLTNETPTADDGSPLVEVTDFRVLSPQTAPSFPSI